MRSTSSATRPRFGTPTWGPDSLTGYLVDTSAISMFAPERSPVPDGFRAWSAATGGDWWIPTIVISEIEFGILRLRRSGAMRRADQLGQWFEGLVAQFVHRLADFDRDAAHELARLNDRLTAEGRHPGTADLVIAATARARGFPVLTCNLRHFSAAGVPTIDPFQFDTSRS